MARLTLYDGPDGEAVWPAEPDPPGVVVTADDHEPITFALNPGEARAALQFAVDPGGRLLAGIEFDAGDDLTDVHEAIQDRVDDERLPAVEEVPPALAVFHQLADPDPPTPPGPVQRHIADTEGTVRVGVPTAAAAVGVATFVAREAPDERVVVVPVGETIGAVDAEVVVVVDDELEAATPLDRGTGVGEVAAGPTEIDEPVADPADLGTAVSGATDPVLRLYDAETGQLEYDSRSPADPPAERSEAAVEFAADGLALFVDREAGAVRALLEPPGGDGAQRFVAAYHHPAGGDDLLASFTGQLTARVAELGMEFAVAVGGTRVDYEALADADPEGPPALADVDWATGNVGTPLDFLSPEESALQLAAVLEHHLDAVESLAICAAGRTDYLSGVDLVVTPDADCDTVQPRSESAALLLDQRLPERLAPAHERLAAVAARVDEVTGTPQAAQRLFGANLSGGALGERGLTLAPADDPLVERRRKQAGYLTLSILLAAGLAHGVLNGPLDRLNPGQLTVPAGPLTGVAGLPGTIVIDGSFPVVALLAVLPLATYHIYGPRLHVNPLRALVALLLGNVERAKACLRDAPRLPTVEEHAEAVHESVRDAAAAYERLADHDATTAGQADDFGAFLETQLFGQADVPEVRVVRRVERWQRQLGAVATGVVVGAATAAVVLALLQWAVLAAPRYPPVAVALVVSLAGIAVLAAALKAAAVIGTTLRTTAARRGVRRS